MNKEEKKLSYSGIHTWVLYNWGKAIHCDNDLSHIAKRFEWANISGEYRKDRNDWKQLCPSCHRKFDWKPEFNNRLSRINKGNRNSIKSVLQFTKNGTFIRKYDAIKDAVNLTGISNTAIANCKSGRSRTAGGFIWR